ncbi:hypothetical protein Ani05nite_11850 [Amorphoplanes nipponensis]|uniref:PknH-like extracellular domain-containing protein n=2 Tax=Actinoplanes nipponensis TaxID=135950 RepID=A0A919JC39_9ACTN|nr:hypothetical protein [Actinoplanes nipponensis]GIE47651.1 hypothetical protein Ani05nite_11850 [Actinoplanes nipponensis]
MVVIGRVLRAVVAACAVAAFAGCSSDDTPEPDGTTISVDTVRNALLKAADVGPTWKTPAESAAPGRLVSICGADTAPAAVPGNPQLVSAPLSDEGTEGVQSLTQIGLVYEDTVSAATALAALRTVADACPPSVSQPAKTGDREEPAYTETARTAPLEEGGWIGFVTTRNKQYDKEHAATADVAVAAVARGNVVLVDQYAIYRLGKSDASANPQFSADWQKLVGTTLNRIGGQ